MSSQFAKKRTTLIVYGAHPIVLDLTTTLLSEDGAVIIADDYRKERTSLFQDFHKHQTFKYITLESIPRIDSVVSKIDYIFILLDQHIDCKTNFSSNEYIEIINTLQATLNYAQNTNTKVAITFPLNRYPSSPDNVKQYTIDDLLSAIKKKINELNEKNRFVRIVYTGEVLGPGMSTQGNTPLKKIIFDSTINQKITIDGEGLDSYYVIYSADYVYGLVKANFSKNTDNSILSNHEKISTMTFAYKVIEHNPSVKNIEFDEKTKLTFNESLDPEEKSETFSTRFEIDEIVQRTNTYAHTVAQKKKTTKAEPVITNETTTQLGETIREEYTFLGKILHFFKIKLEPQISKEKESVKTSWNYYIKDKKKLFSVILLSILTGIIFYFTIIPITVIAFETNKSYKALKNYQTVASNPTTEVKQYVDLLDNSNQSIQKAWKTLSWVEHVPIIDKFYNETDKLIVSLDLSSQALNNVEYIRVPLLEYLTQINIAEPLNGTITSTRVYTKELEEINKNLPYLKTATQYLFQTSEIIATIDPSYYPEPFSTKIAEIKEKVSSNRQYIDTIYTFTSELSDLVGIDGQRTYIILIHNPYELRPHGGWISGYGILKIRYGQIVSLSFENIYNLDGILKNNSLWFNLPNDFAKFTDYPTQTWTPSTINWEQDYSKLHIELEDMLKSIGVSTTVDGVVSVNLFSLQALLQKTGPIYISSTNQTVTSDNLMDIVNQYHNEFTPETDNKADILTQIAEQIYIEIAKGEKVSTIDILNLLKEEMDQKNIVISMKNTVLQAEIEKIHKTINKITDNGNLFIYPLEWNYGGNKSNAFLNRAISINIETSSSLTSGTISLDYLNQSVKDVYPEGIYYAYGRLYLPSTVNVTQVVGISEYWIEKNNNFTIVYFKLDVGLSQNKTVKIFFSSTNSFRKVSLIKPSGYTNTIFQIIVTNSGQKTEGNFEKDIEVQL
ncbi:MAG TPA: DUF4012 domain-containing protein [Candidatus Dojkabacteria bacterium]|nr:DUF4012 domain-containing protein [Candidatus Dojkabacteria bacterium]HQF36303.1 DUF4012 domain-containing protein [Candidatus Dojkabacteria bacterium]